MSAPAHDASPAARLVGVSKSFGGVEAVREVTLDVPTDTITGLLGRNGAGKTTIMRLLTGQLLADRGRVEVHGRAPFENETALSRMCFIREGQAFPTELPVAGVLRAAALALPGWDAAYARELAHDFGLAPKRHVGKLSRGMLSAVGVVVGLASRAPVTFFDEPYLGLDAVARQMFYDRLLEDYASRPRTVVLSTHLIDEVSGLLEHVVLVDGGRVLLQEGADALRSRGGVLTGPAHLVDTFLAGRPVLHMERLAGTCRSTVDWELSAADRSELHRLDIAVEPLSLQQRMVRTTSAPPSAPDDPSHRTAVEGARR